jgi:hypothetical protein
MLKEDLRRANVTSSVEWAIAHKRYFLWVANAAVSLSSSRKAWVADETATRCGDCWGKGCGGGAISRSHEPAFCNAAATLPSSASLLKLSGASIFGVAPLAFLPVPSVELERQITSSHCRAALHAIARCLFGIRVSALEASGGEGGIRSLSGANSSASCRFNVAPVANNANRLALHCPILPDNRARTAVRETS